MYLHNFHKRDVYGLKSNILHVLRRLLKNNCLSTLSSSMTPQIETDAQRITSTHVIYTNLQVTQGRLLVCGNGSEGRGLQLKQ